MTESLISIVRTASDILLSDGSVIVPAGGVNFNVRFQEGYDPAAGGESADATNVVVTLIRLGTSPTAQEVMQDHSGDTVFVNITNNPSDDGSGGADIMGIKIVNINTNDINNQYRTVNPGHGGYENFNLQHIVNHEVMHPLFDMEESQAHNQLVNQINSETGGGPPRSDNYWDVKIWEPLTDFFGSDLFDRVDDTGFAAPGTPEWLEQQEALAEAQAAELEAQDIAIEPGATNEGQEDENPQDSPETDTGAGVGPALPPPGPNGYPVGIGGGVGQATYGPSLPSPSPSPSPFSNPDGYGPPVGDLHSGSVHSSELGNTRPVILDLDQDGVEVTFGQDIFFDIDGDGYAERTTWAASDDAFLVVDLSFDIDGSVLYAADGSFAAGDGDITSGY